MKRLGLCVTALVCLLMPVLAGCEPAQNPNIPKSFCEKEEHFQGGFLDCIDFCVYSYHLDEFAHNSRYEVIDEAGAKRVRGYFGNFSTWIQGPIERGEYRFDPACINEGDYVRIETKCEDPAHETYENYTVYFADRETNTLYYINLS